MFQDLKVPIVEGDGMVTVKEEQRPRPKLKVTLAMLKAKPTEPSDLIF